MPVSPYEGWNNAPYLPGISMEAGGGAVAQDAQSGDGEDLSFWDFLDVINPLQHIPVVGSLYRELTGDTIRGEAKLAGGALFFGPVGLGLAALDVGVEEITGAPIDQHVIAMFNGDDAGRNALLAKKNEQTGTTTAGTETPEKETGAVTETARTITADVPSPSRHTPGNSTGTPTTEPATATLAGPMFPVNPAAPPRLSRASKPVTPPRIPASSIRPLAGPAAMTPLERLVQESSQHLRQDAVTMDKEKPEAHSGNNNPETQKKKALKLQGLTPLEASTTTTPPVSLTHPGTPGQAPVSLPAWADSAIQKAAEAYRKADRLPRP